MREFTCPKAGKLIHPSTNRARCRATALIETNALPLHQTANRAGRVKKCDTDEEVEDADSQHVERDADVTVVVEPVVHSHAQTSHSSDRLTE